MKNIELLGIDYTEEMIDVLADFEQHMNDMFTNKIINRDGTLESIMEEIEDEKVRYFNRLDEDDKFVLAHFIKAGMISQNTHPIVGIALMIPIVAATCFIASFGAKIFISAMVAGVLTYEFKALFEKNAYNKIMKIIQNKVTVK